MSYLYEATPPGIGYSQIVGPENAPLRWLSFGRLRLVGRGTTFSRPADPREHALCLLSGRCQVRLHDGGQRLVAVFDVQRSDPFSEAPAVVYVPRDLNLDVICMSDFLDVGLVGAEARRQCNPFLSCLSPAEAEVFGTENWRRKVYLPIAPIHDADRLIVGETHSPPGNWSSFPPHKHDSYDPPAEMPAEEIYFFQLDPPQGFGYQRLYTDPKDPAPLSEVYVIRNGDTVVIPRGYHPVVVAPGYRMVTLWAFATDNRVFGAWTRDPQHAWLGPERGRT